MSIIAYLLKYYSALKMYLFPKYYYNKLKDNNGNFALQYNFGSFCICQEYNLTEMNDGGYQLRMDCYSYEIPNL